MGKMEPAPGQAPPREPREFPAVKILLGACLAVLLWIGYRQAAAPTGPGLAPGWMLKLRRPKVIYVVEKQKPVKDSMKKNAGGDSSQVDAPSRPTSDDPEPKPVAGAKRTYGSAPPASPAPSTGPRTDLHVPPRVLYWDTELPNALGDVWFSGEALNGSSTETLTVEVMATAYDSVGGIISTNETFVKPVPLAPGTKGTFRSYVERRGSRDIARIEVKAIDREAPATPR